ncbi:mycothiol conjugate amidase Mca [soil metagenome]
MHSLLTVHAHPDDETITTGGIMARYSRAGQRVMCVTCTGGEEGEIVVPELDTPTNHARLAEMRPAELRRALERLGPIQHAWLGYRDSGMMGLPQNDAVGSLWSTDFEEAAGRLVGIVRRFRPQVIVGYNAYGGYGHPDHIRAAQLAVAAFEWAGDSERYPEQLAEGRRPWAPLKLYESAWDLSRRRELAELMRARGVSSWLSPDPDEDDVERAERESQLARMAEASGPLTSRVDISDLWEDKLAALREHVTQLGPEFFLLVLPADEWRHHQPTEDFTLRVSRVGVRLPEDGLFAGLPAEA